MPFAVKLSVAMIRIRGRGVVHTHFGLGTVSREVSIVFWNLGLDRKIRATYLFAVACRVCRGSSLFAIGFFGNPAVKCAVGLAKGANLKVM